VLKDALENYDGTLIVVSHDRDFLDGLAQKIYEFKDKKIKEHTGDIFEFLRRKKLDNLKEIERRQTQNSKINEQAEPSDNKVKYLEKKEFEREKRRLENKVKKAEESIQLLEAKLEKLVEVLANPDTISNDDDPFGEFGRLKEKLELEMKVWEEAVEELEGFTG
jgi:ATP-binding cassette subfamily F protein 3